MKNGASPDWNEDLLCELLDAWRELRRWEGHVNQAEAVRKVDRLLLILAGFPENYRTHWKPERENFPASKLRKMLTGLSGKWQVKTWLREIDKERRKLMDAVDALADLGRSDDP